MDLYDLGNYFASYIPVKALQSPLLRYSACAIAAKQLGRVKGLKSIMGGICSKQASSETYSNIEQAHWFYIAAGYYDKAITQLRAALSQINTQDSCDMSQTEFSERSVDDIQVSENRRRGQADDLLAATSILSVYEFMDDSNAEWSRSVVPRIDKLKIFNLV